MAGAELKSGPVNHENLTWRDFMGLKFVAKRNRDQTKPSPRKQSSIAQHKTRIGFDLGSDGFSNRTT